MGYETLSKAATGASSARGADTGAREVSQHFSPSATATRQNARVVKANADKALAEAQGTPYTQEDLKGMAENQSQVIQNTVAQNQATHAGLVQQKAYASFNRFEADGNVKHMNQALADLTRADGTRIVPDVIRFDPVTEALGNDLQRDYGITFEEYQADPELSNFFLAATMQDGSTKLVPTQSLLAGTGYDRVQTDEALSDAERRANIFYKMQGRNAANTSAKERQARAKVDTLRPDDPEWKEGNPEYDLAYVEELERLSARTENLTQDEAEAERQTIAARPEGMDENQWAPGNPEYDAEYNKQFTSIAVRDRETSKQKNLVGARAARDSIDARAESEGSFFNVDFSDRQNKSVYESDMRDYMKLGGIELPEEVKRKSVYIRELIGLADDASSVGEAETGVIDTLFRDVRKYIRDDVSGLDLTSSYAAFRNTVLHAKAGATLTDGEIKLFTEAFGSLKQQEGPVLAQFKTALQQVRDQVSGIMNLEDSYVSHYYLGSDQETLNQMVDALDERIDFLGTLEAKVAAPGVTAYYDPDAPPGTNAVYTNPVEVRQNWQSKSPEEQQAISRQIYEDVYGRPGALQVKPLNRGEAQ